jgi:ABC-type phosphate transport system auxiliary subunit
MKTNVLIFLITFNVFATEKQALMKIQEFGKTLKAELKKGFQQSPTKALKICNVEAPVIQNKVSSNKIKVGRVSMKNRNPSNYPKDWMLPLISDFQNNKIKKQYVVIKLKNDKHGLLKPIKTDSLCLNCHGENVREELKKEIIKLYPEDKAMGYKAGDIRGYFWAIY